MFGVIMPLCNRMFCCIFGRYFFIKIRQKYEKKIFCCPALELFCCLTHGQYFLLRSPYLPLWKTILLSSSIQKFLCGFTNSTSHLTSMYVHISYNQITGVPVGITMRTNLLNWCNLVSISKNVVFYAFLVVRIY